MKKLFDDFDIINFIDEVAITKLADRHKACVPQLKHDLGYHCHLVLINVIYVDCVATKYT